MYSTAASKAGNATGKYASCWPARSDIERGLGQKHRQNLTDTYKSKQRENARLFLRWISLSLVKAKPCGDDYSLNFRESFHVRLHQRPQLVDLPGLIPIGWASRHFSYPKSFWVALNFHRPFACEYCMVHRH